VPVLVLHGDDDQIVPYEATALRSIELLQKGKIIIYPGLSHGMLTVNADIINKDILDFIKS